ncbi:hypothetical protein B0J15DRAFT_461494 [Fusarium solani]|uniref:Uncharacterized protein n=1 Tax=Fusarium solani TaxID=169388 RepID=A0A9P9L003_FUSSL|nr:uncharacterized protein B0J15DRAFT_461494 [Fusarium solani]KAH7271458.1 hypothetical protein B0J15DRAFT_461494 [Fusarium solani]
MAISGRYPLGTLSLGLAGESCSKGNGSGEWVSRAWGVAGGGWVCVGSWHPGPSDALNRLPGMYTPGTCLQMLAFQCLAIDPPLGEAPAASSRILDSLWPAQMPRCLAFTYACLRPQNPASTASISNLSVRPSIPPESLPRKASSSSAGAGAKLDSSFTMAATAASISGHTH